MRLLFLICLLFSSQLYAQVLVHYERLHNYESFNDDSVKTSENIFNTSADDKLEGSFTLHQNYPNPFNPSTTISYEIKKTSYIELSVYDALGRFIKMVDEGIKIPGHYKVRFDPENLSTGIYFYQLISGEYKTQNKMLLLK